MTAFPAILATLFAVAVTLDVVIVNAVPGKTFQGGRLLQVAWFIAIGLWLVWGMVK